MRKIFGYQYKLRHFLITSILWFVLIFAAQGARGQCPPLSKGYDNIKFGITAGYNMSSYISGLETTILSEPYFLNYSLKNLKVNDGYQFGLFLNKKFEDSPLASYSEISYSKQNGRLNFENNQQFTYDMLFNYQYINFLSMLRYYPFLAEQNGNGHAVDFYFGIGPQLGFNVASDNIEYHSGGPGYSPAFGTDLDQQQQLRNVLKGKTDFGVSTEAGFIIPKWRIDLSFRWHKGLTDLVETTANSYNFIENKNGGTVLQIVLKVDMASLRFQN